MPDQNSKEETPEMSQTPLPVVSKERPRRKILIVLGSLVLLIIVGGIYLIEQKFSQKFLKKSEENVYQPGKILAPQFATYKELPVNISPKVSNYSISQDLGNVTNANDFFFSDNAKNLLIKNAFVVTPAYHDEFFPLYETNRYSYTPSFITVDSALHNYHLFFDFLLRQLEEQKLAAELRDLNGKMLSESLNQYEALKGSEWENAAKRNVGFFAVGGKLLDPSVSIPPIVAEEVNQELALIDGHQGIEKSPVMNIGSKPQEALKEDYSQYVPRGHYDKTDLLKAYFKSMMWYGRLTFRIKNEDEVKSAILITLALEKDDNHRSWERIYEPLSFLIGKSDDINYYHFHDLLEKAYGPNVKTAALLTDKDKFASFLRATETLVPPQINSLPIFQSSIQANREEEIKGFRFMGQRFTIDASILQRLVYREVGDKSKSCQAFKPEETGCLSGARCLPKGLDIPAALGSKEAENILREMGEDQYACYRENMSKMQTYLSNLSPEHWTQNLYWGWLYQLLPLLETKKDGYPPFMRNVAWLRKSLNTFLGSWTELKHDTILYAKQVYAELGGGPPQEKDDRGYVEPNPYVYARLAALTRMTIEGLEARGLLTESMKDNLAKLEQLAIYLKTIAEKELDNEALSDEEYEFIRSYGGQLEHFWLEVNKDEPAFKEARSQRDYLNDNPAAIIADVATDPNGWVLEEGTGRIFEIYVVVPIDGKLRITKGGVYSYYEFAWPMTNRLTDGEWRELLSSGQPPALPSWADAFVAK